MISVVSIDDHCLFYQGLKAILDKESDLDLVAGYENGNDIHEIVQHDAPDVILLDVHLPGKSGISIAEKIKHIAPAIKVIMLSMEVELLFIEKLESIGVEAYVSKYIGASDLLDLIRAVNAGETFPLSVLHHAGAKIPNLLTEEYCLTERELEVYEYTERGFSSEEIAKILFRSVWTIRTHRKNIKQKLKMKDEK